MSEDTKSDYGRIINFYNKMIEICKKNHISIEVDSVKDSSESYYKLIWEDDNKVFSIEIQVNHISDDEQLEEAEEEFDDFIERLVKLRK